MKEFGENLKKMRLKKKLTQSQLGAMCNPVIALTNISKYERGVINPSFDRLVIFKEALNCSYDDLFAGATSEIKEGLNE